MHLTLNEGDSFFSGKQTSIVHSEAPLDTVARIAYTMGNPVADGIEREGKNHKGTRLRWPRPEQVIKRPEGFFRKPENGGVAPDEVTLRFTRPPGHEHLGDAKLDKLLDEETLAYEKEKREERDAAGKPFRCDVTDTLPDPKSYPRSRHRLFGLSPLIGAKDKSQRLAAIARLRNFRRRYKAARLRVLGGETGIVFPYGTFFAEQRWGMAVEQAPELSRGTTPKSAIAPPPT